MKRQLLGGVSQSCLLHPPPNLTQQLWLQKHDQFLSHSTSAWSHSPTLQWYLSSVQHVPETY